MKALAIPVVLLITLLSGCAAPPTAQQLGQLPVVRFGETPPADGDFILHFPAGQPIPTEIAFSGNLLSEAREQTLSVSLNKEIYSYKEWLSFDKVHWQDARQSLDLKVKIKLPGYQHPKPGFIRLRLDEK